MIQILGVCWFGTWKIWDEVNKPFTFISFRYRCWCCVGVFLGIVKNTDEVYVKKRLSSRRLMKSVIKDYLYITIAFYGLYWQKWCLKFRLWEESKYILVRWASHTDWQEVCYGETEELVIEHDIHMLCAD